MPLRFFPDWFIRICYLTPFPHMINSIVETYLGMGSGADSLKAIISQAIWAMLLFLAGQVVFRAGVKRLVVQGG